MLKRLLPLVLTAACAESTIAPPEVEPEQPVYPAEAEPTATSVILYAPHVRGDVADEEEEPPFAEIDTTPASRVAVAEAAIEPAWNSRAGRLAAAPLLALDDDAARARLGLNEKPAASACITPEYMTGNENLKLPDGTRLKSPATAFGTATDAKNYLKSVRAHMPMYLPFSHPDVELGHGWIYNGGGSHRGQDYSRSGVSSGDDPTFAVRAAAPGKVIDVYWGNAGNGVVVEHTAPDGFKFITVYYHLRNGHDNDLAKAKAMDCGTSGDSRCTKYKKFAQNYPNHVSWGTNAHTLKVKIGDSVSGGQQLGWAGNTGPGGAGNGLEDDGSPKSPRGNVHLHTYWGAQHPSEAKTYVHVDPYGVYNKESTGCYDLLEDTDFARTLAPFYENFHNLPAEVLLKYFNYYSAMGMSPRTLSIHDGDGLRASGSFQRGIPGTWYTRINMNGTQLQSRFNEYYALGLIPREMTVIPDGDEARFTATFRALQPGEHFDHRAQMTNSVWNQKWTALVSNAGWRVADYFGYTVDGVDYQAALFTDNTPRPFYLWTKYSYSGLKAKIEDGMKNGLAPVSVTVSELDDATVYNAIMRRQPGCWKWYVGLSVSSYQSVFSDLSSRGYRLEKVQGYDDSDKYAAVFTLASGATPAVCP